MLKYLSFLALTLALMACRGGGGSNPTPVPTPDGNHAPVVAVTNPTTDVSTLVGSTVNFSGTASDPDGDSVTTNWNFGDGQTATNLITSHVYTVVGSYTVTFTATDSKGLSSHATRKVTVSSVVVPPSSTYGTFRLVGSGQKLPLTVGSTTSTTITLATPRAGHKALPIGGGKFMLIGGEMVNVLGSDGTTYNDQNSPNNSVIDIFDSATETFNHITTPTNVARKWRSDGRWSFAMTQLPDGRVLIFGGAENQVETLEIFNPADNSIQYVTGVFSDPINNAVDAYYIGNNKVLLIQTWYSGVNNDPILKGNAIIDLTNMKGTFISTPMNVRETSSVALADGSVIYAGGMDSSFQTHSEIWKIDPTTLATTQVGTLLSPRQDYGMTVLSDGQIGIYGGIARGTSIIRYKSVEIVNPNTWTSTGSLDLLGQRSFTKAVLLQTNSVLNAGGADETGGVASDEFVHNHLIPVSGTTGNMVFPRRHYSVIALNNGRLLISGGESLNQGAFDSAEIYDPGAKLLISYDTSTQIKTSSIVHFTSDQVGVVWSLDVSDGTHGMIDQTGLFTAPTASTQVKITGTLNGISTTVTFTVIQ